MADNIIINAPTVPGGQIVASDDVGGVQHELVKVEFGTDGNATMVSTGNPLPVTDAVAEAALASIAGEDFATQATLLNIYNKLLASIAVTIASLPLPAGAAISANQQTDALTNTQLRAAPVPVTGTLFGGAVTIADGADVAEGAIADAIVAAGATGTLSAKLRRVTQGLEDLKTLISVLPLPTGASTSANQALELTALGLLLTTSDFDTKTGSLTETAPATDTASSGLNGRLQRIAQRLTSLIALYPTALGAGGGFKIDGSGTALPVSGTVAVTGAGDASAANQVAGNASLVSILAKLTAAAASFVKLEDTASADADAGVPAMAIRKATPANLSGTDGDYEILQMSAGRLWVSALIDSAIAAGSNIIGKVGIDQTTPGTTNGVQVNNTVTTTESSPATIFNGKTNVTTAGTRVTLAASQVVKSVTIKALSTNTGLIYVGNATVSSANGFQLSAGDTVSMDISNLNTINIDSAVNGEGVTYFSVAT